MSLQADIKFKGIKEVRAGLKALQPKEAAADIRASLRQGMKPVLADTRTAVRGVSASGAWLASLGISTASLARIRRGKEGRGIVGRASVVANGKKKRAIALWNQYQMAKGNKEGFPKRGLFHHLIVDEYGFKGVPPKRLMARSLAANGFNAPETFAKELKKKLEKRWQQATLAR